MEISFGGALFLVFLVLKLTGVIAWSWLWVTAPLWVGAILTVGIWFILVPIGIAIYALFKPKNEKPLTRSRSNFKNHSTF